MRDSAWDKYDHLEYKEYLFVGEHKIKQPPLPSNPKYVFFIDCDVKDAYWDREKMLKDYRDIWFKYIPFYTEMNAIATTYDERGAVATLDERDSLYIEKTLELEVKRRTDGIFYRIKNEIVHIPGDMYFTLMWCRTKRPIENGVRKDYFDFRFFQLEFFKFVEYIIEQQDVLGAFISKPKKTGITNLMWLIFLNRITMTKNVNMGNMNIDQKKGAKTFRDYFMYAFNGLPPILQPQIKSLSENDGNIVFGKRGGSRKGNNYFNNPDTELGSGAICVPCVQHAFDVDVFSIVWYDEPPKYINDFGEIYRSNSRATSIQDLIVGKVFLTSYTPDNSDKSFMSARELYFDSKIGTSDKNKSQTKSRLLCYHIDSKKSWWTSIDKYGYCNEKEAYGKIIQNRNELKDRPKQLQAEIRAYAFDDKEAWSVGGKGSIFDPIRLGEIMDGILDEKRNNPRGLFTPGNLRWVNESWNLNPSLRRKGQVCEVYFEPLTDEEIESGAEYTTMEYYPLPKEERNIALKFGRDEFGNLNPPPNGYANVLGADPTQHASASEVIEQSTNSYIVMDRQSAIKDKRAEGIGSKRIMYEYHFRPESPDDSYEDLLKLIIFTGSLSAIEGNVPTSAVRLLSEGLGRYMLVKDVAGNPVIWDAWMGMERDTEKKYHLLRAAGNSRESASTKEEFVRLHKAYIRKPFPGGKDYGATIKSENYINDLLQIDIKDSTRKYDTFMGMGWCLWADEMYNVILMYEQENTYSDSDISSVLRALSM